MEKQSVSATLAIPLYYFTLMQSARTICLLALLFLQWTVHAQWRGPQLTRLGPAEGLPTSILDFTQDSTGYLYLASNTGMYRYDGNTFEFFGHNPMDDTSIGPGDVFSIYASGDGLIWMTLRFGGLNSFDPKTSSFRHYQFPEMPDKSVPGGFGLYEDEDGILWVGGLQFRLMSYNKTTDTFLTYIPDWVDPGDPRRLTILSIVPDKFDSQLLWISVLDYQADATFGDSYGLVTFDKRTKQFQDHPCVGQTRYVDDQGALWGTVWGNWITRYDPRTQQCDKIDYEVLYDGRLEKPLSWDVIRYQDEILVSSSLALFRYHPGDNLEAIAKPSSTYETFHALFCDRSDNLWIGSRQGAYVLNPADQHIRFFSLSQFGFDDRIYPGRLAYHAGDDVVYLSHPNSPELREIYAIPLSEDKKTEAVAIDPGFHVQALTCDFRDRIWLAGKGAFYLMDPETKHVKSMNLSASGAQLPGLQIMSSHRDGWIGAHSRNEFIWFHADSLNMHRINFSQLSQTPDIYNYGNRFHGFFLARNHKAFLFTNEVYLVDLHTGSVDELKYDVTSNPMQLDIQSVVEDAEGNVWMSSFFMLGKYRLTGDSLVLKDAFTINDGMISPTATELHIDNQQRIWIFMISGINAIDPVTREVRFFGTKQGLPDSWNDPVQVLSLADGRIASVCANGLIVFDPEELWNSVTPSSETVVINEIRIAGDPLVTEKSINSLEVLKLKPGYSVVDIEFQGLAYPTDYRTEYSYRIKGLQNDWISLGKNKLVTLPDLSPGTYRLEVKTGKPHSNSPVKSLSIFIETPYYLRWWFFALMLILLASGIIALTQWRVYRVRKQEAERTEINKQIAELELKALRSQMNPHFMFNSLNSIKNYILHSEPKLAAEYLSNFAHLIRLILQNSREKSISLQEELETLVLYIELERLRFDEKFDFSYVVDEDVQLEKIKIPPMLLQPYMENAIWHGLMHKKERGHLLLQFSRQGEMIACIIEDDGVGRENAQKMKSLSATRYKSMGMGITQDRIEIMNKMDALGISTEITDNYDASGKPSGTRVVIRIPASNELYT